ncbi:ATP-binding protein [Ulvibacterium sp.]|uniref:ATP-binding protein n=1 Tax=Ulvibacterium sp. TaxID=2665914 RepID=UPI002630B261|nr:ATP-binding protein [Ulvibacterium sp.]
MSDLIKNNQSGELEISVKFRPRARLLKQLGDQLIKNESIALIELVKNSYDADASKVDIYMENVDSDEKGVIIIEDDGFGMSAKIVEDVWMEPGSDFKSKKFDRKEVTPKYKRLPIGEKGIGRFGVHKLGNHIEMTTKMEDNPEVVVRINWEVLDEHKYLEDVPVKLIVRRIPEFFKDGATGTNIVISKLQNLWKRGVARSVKRSINSMTSPFEADDSFKANFEILDKPGWFEGLLPWKDIKEYSLFYFEIEMEGSKITRFKYSFKPWDTMNRVSGRTLNENDDIVSKFLELKDSDKKLFSLSKYAIGKIRFKGFIFDRDSFVFRLGMQLEKSSFNGYLNYNGGVKVFRNGMRVYDYGEPENDWLDMNQRRVNDPSKRISKNIIIGAVYLDRHSSTDLVEKTNREGFVENEAYSFFKDAVIHGMELIENFRFQDKRRLKEVYGPTRKSEPVLQILGELKGFVDKEVEDEEIRSTINKYLVKIENDYQRINNNLLKAAGAGLSLSVVVHEVEKIIIEVQKVLKAEKGSERVLKLVRHLSSLIDGYSEIIRKSTRTNEDLRGVIDQAIFNTEYRLSSHKIEIVKGYLSLKSGIKVRIAKSLLIGSLMNLIDNSIFWLDKAGREEKKLFFDISESEPGFVNLIIADNGTGFLLPTDEILEPFVSGKPGGMGLGLHIASEIMAAHKGKLWFPDVNDFEIPHDFKEGAIIALGFKK